MVKKILFYNLAFLVLGLLILELSFGHWISGSQIGKILVPRDVHYVFDMKADRQATQDEEVHYVRDRWGLRGKYPQPSQIDILTLGGSTTDQRYVTEGKTWQDTLAKCLSEQRKKPIYVVNAGVDGHSAYGHLESFEKWFPQIPRLKAKYILVYTSLNDWAALSQGNNPHLGVEEAQLRRRDTLKKKSAIFYLYSVMLGAMNAKVTTMTHWQAPVPQTFPDVKTVRELQDEMDKDPNFFLNRDTKNPDLFKQYEERLTALDRRIRDFGSKPIYVSQRRMYYRVKGDLVESVGGGFSEFKLWRQMSKTAERVAKKSGSLFIDLQSEIQFEPEDFYDPTHNNSNGTQKIGHFLCQKLESLNL